VDYLKNLGDFGVKHQTRTTSRRLSFDQELLGAVTGAPLSSRRNA
jgi:hypothetical protein